MENVSQHTKKILITFARSPLALDLARQLHSAGHQIIAVDSIKNHISRFSKAVAKTYIVPAPSHTPNKYVEALIKIVKEESIDLLLPIFEEAACIAKYKDQFPKSCKIFISSFDLFHELHHKWLFQCRLKKIGLRAVTSTLVTNQEELHSLNFKTPFLLKACYSRASHSLTKLHPGQPLPDIHIDKDNPLIAQEWLEGNKYCSYSICNEGTVFAHALYPVQYAIGGNSCIMFESIEHAEILEWIRTFVKETNYTGQIAFDFIQTRNKKVYAIECNPRATSGLHLFDPEDRLDRAFFAQNTTPIFPKKAIKKQLAIGMMLYGWQKTSYPNNTLRNFLKDFSSIKDVIYHSNDMKPFLLKPMIFAFLFKHALKSKLPLPEYFTYDHHWNGTEL